MKGTGKVYALKVLNKVEMLKRHQVGQNNTPTYVQFLLEHKVVCHVAVIHTFDQVKRLLLLYSY